MAEGSLDLGEIKSYDLKTVVTTDLGTDESFFFVEMSDYDVLGQAETMKTTEYKTAAKAIATKTDLQEGITRNASGDITAYKLTSTTHDQTTGDSLKQTYSYIEMGGHVGGNPA